ncbi:MAG: FapA family protein [Spirochaetia bacterium]|nr:FapA family protein [Spirochaetia bacterium]
MKMSKLRQTLLSLELEEAGIDANEIPSEVEIYADSVKEALALGAQTTMTSISDLEYEIIKKGSPGILGMFRTPYHVMIKKTNQSKENEKWNDIDDIDVSLTTGVKLNDFGEEVEPDVDGRSIVRVYANGIFLKIISPKGNGNPVTLNAVHDTVVRYGIENYDRGAVEKAIKNESAEPVKIGNYSPRQGADSSMTMDILPDEMSATVTFSSPRPGGKHLTVKDIVNALRNANVEYGFQEEAIQDALDNDRYGQPVVAAKGDPPVNGKDGHIDYKVRISKKIEFKEDESGKIDFLAKDLIENVVQGQVLAELAPPEKGKPGRTLFNKILPATDGLPTELRAGKGTILSEDGKQLIAEKNGQVVFIGGRVNVEENFTVGGDVGLDTGNIMFLGSVTVRGSVSDNMEVKAAGNIEVAGTVQKAHLEAEGDVIVRQGIVGRDGAVIESTTGSVFAKFVQNTYVSVEKDVIVAEGILHSKIHAGSKIICNGKRAQIVGGEIMAGEEVRVKQLGAQASTPTIVIVGTNPKILQQITQLENIQKQAKEKLEKIDQNIRTLTVQKTTQGEEFTEAKEAMLNKMISGKEKLNDRLNETESEKKQLQEYLQILAARGKVHVEKTLFPGVKIIINEAEFTVNDEYNNVTLIAENGNIKILPYEDEEGAKKKRGRRR